MRNKHSALRNPELPAFVMMQTSSVNEGGG